MPAVTQTQTQTVVFEEVISVDQFREAVVAAKQNKKSAHNRRTHGKSRNGCLECKSRRLKCDEKLPACSRCANKKGDCQYPIKTRSQPAAVLRENPAQQQQNISSIDDLNEGYTYLPPDPTLSSLDRKSYNYKDILETPYALQLFGRSTNHSNSQISSISYPKNLLDTAWSFAALHSQSSQIPPNLGNSIQQPDFSSPDIYLLQYARGDAITRSAPNPVPKWALGPIMRRMLDEPPENMPRYLYKGILHAILTLTASHVHHFNGSDSMPDFILSAEIRHRKLALQIFRHAVSVGITSESLDAILIMGFILCAHSFTFQEAFGIGFNAANSTMKLLPGLLLIIGTAHSKGLFDQSMFAPVSQVMTGGGRWIACNPPKYDLLERGWPRQCENLVRMFTVNRPLTSLPPAADHLIALYAVLEKGEECDFEDETLRRQVLPLIFLFPDVAGEEFMAGARRGELQNLVILAYFYHAVSTCADSLTMWWLKKRALFEGAALCRLLDAAGWGEWINWD